MRTRTLCLGVAVATLLLAGLLGAFASAQDKNVILIGWDGAQRGHVNEMIERGELPNLVALAKDGTKIDIDVITGNTDTKAGWTQILTGYAPAKTGVYGNGRYQPIPVGYTIFERVEAQLGADNVQTMAMIGKKGHVDADAPRKVPLEQWQRRQANQQRINQAKPGLGNLEGGTIVEENGQRMVSLPGKPYFNTKDHMDSFVNGLLTNEKVGTMALENIEKYKDNRFLFFVHFAEPDHAGHRSGENSQEYTDALKLDDEWTGKILAKLKDLGLYDKTLVYVVVDHGFDEGKLGHGYAPYVFVATNDKAVNRNGTREDIAPTVLKRFGVDLSKIEPALDGIPLDQPAPERKAPATKPAPARRPAAARRAARAATP